MTEVPAHAYTRNHLQFSQEIQNEPNTILAPFYPRFQMRSASPSAEFVYEFKIVRLAS